MQAWIIAVLYIFELLIQTFYSPDVDMINGFKTAAQVGLQTIVILTVALITSGQVDSNYGQSLCIQVSLVQVFLAVPEQIWGVLTKTVLRKSGPPREPDFKTTEEELRIEREISATSFKEKLKAVCAVLKNIKPLTAVLKEGGTVIILVEIVSRKKLLMSLETLDIGGLALLFESIFCCEAVRKALECEKKTLPQIAEYAEGLLLNKWHTSVDIKKGIYDLYNIQDILDNPSTEVVPVVSASDGAEQVKVHGSMFGTTFNQHCFPLIGSGQYFPQYPTSVTAAVQEATVNAHPHFIQVSPSGQQLLVGHTVPMFGPPPQYPWFLYAGAPNFAISGPPPQYPWFLYAGAPNFAISGQFSFPGQDQSETSQQCSESNCNESEADNSPESPQHLSNESEADFSPDLGLESCQHLSNAVLHHCDDLLKQEQQSTIMSALKINLEQQPTNQISADLVNYQGSSLSCGNQAFVESDSGAPDSQDVRNLPVLSQSTFLSSDRADIQELDLFKKQQNVADKLSTPNDENNGLNKSFKAHLLRIFGAIDAETLDGIHEKLMAALPEQLTSLVDEIPDGLKAAVELVALNSERKRNQRMMRRKMESLQRILTAIKLRRLEMILELWVIIIFIIEQACASPNESTETFLVTTGAAVASQIANTEKSELPHAGIAVSTFLGIRWDWILFWVSVLMALASLLVLTALANTTCMCSPASNY